MSFDEAIHAVRWWGRVSIDADQGVSVIDARVFAVLGVIPLQGGSLDEIQDAYHAKWRVERYNITVTPSELEEYLRQLSEKGVVVKSAQSYSLADSARTASYLYTV